MNGLADWVVDEQLVSPAQLQQARQHQQDNGVPLATALIELNILDEGVLVDLLSRRHALPKAPHRLHRMTIAPKALSSIPQDYCWQHGMFPFGFDAGSRKLQVAICDPGDPEALALLKKIAREILLYVAGPKQLEKAIRKHYLDSWVDDSQGNAKPLRFFGYENITSPGTKAPMRGAQDEGDEGSTSTASPLVELAMAVPPEVEVIGQSSAPAADVTASPVVDRPPVADTSTRPSTPPLPMAVVPSLPSALRRLATPPGDAGRAPADVLLRTPTPPLPTPPLPGEVLRRSPTPPPVSTENMRRTPPPVSTESMRRTPPPVPEALLRSPTVADPSARSSTPPAAVDATPAAADATDDLPASVQLGKLHVDKVGELQLRVEVLERAVAELLAVIGVGAQESSTRLAKISLELRRAAERNPPK
jgi:hypothetical protein